MILFWRLYKSNMFTGPICVRYKGFSSVFMYNLHADVLPLFVYDGWSVVEATAFSCLFPVSVPSVTTARTVTA